MSWLVRILLCAVAALPLQGCDWFLDRALNRPDTTINLPDPPPERLARPVFVVVDGDAVIVNMDDDTQCLGSAGADFAAAGWTGVLSECPYPYTYSVALAAGMPAGQIPLNEVIGPTLPLEDGEVPFRPIASVRVTDTAGQSYNFESTQGF